MIQFIESTRDLPDVVRVCKNCGEISASNIIACPVCSNKNTKLKQIHFYTHDIESKRFPILSITKDYLINHFVPKKIADSLTDEAMINLAGHIFQNMDVSDIIKKHLEAAD